MKTQFNKVKKLAFQLKKESAILDLMIDKKWGFNYSETDDHLLIDTLNYGDNILSFEHFKELMDNYKNNLKKYGKLKV